MLSSGIAVPLRVSHHRPAHVLAACLGTEMRRKKTTEAVKRHMECLAEGSPFLILDYFVKNRFGIKASFGNRWH